MRTARLLACAQIWLSVLVLVAFFGLLFLIVLRVGDKEVLKDLIQLLSPLVTLVLFFWFQRQRPHSDDDPTEASPDPTSPAPPANPTNP